MLGGDNLSGIKEWLNGVKIKFVNFLTPISYTEYVIKMLFILKVKNIFNLLKVDLIIHLIMLLLSIIKPLILRRSSIVFSMILSLIVLGVFALIKSTLKKNQIKVNEIEVEAKPLDPIDVEVPSRLKQFITEEE